MGSSNVKLAVTTTTTPPPPKQHPTSEEFGAGRLYQSLVREHRKSKFLTDVYEVLEEIGQGGLCKVYKIRKKHSKIGGSSRSENVLRRTRWNKRTSPFIRTHLRALSTPTRLFSSSEPISTTTTIFIPGGLDDHEENPSVPQQQQLPLPSQSSSSSPPLPAVVQRAATTTTTTLGESSVVFTEMYFALKEINLAKVAMDQVEQLQREVSFFKALDHKNILKAYETFQENKKVWIVMELLTGGDLHSRFPYTEQQVAHITRQILSAVGYMHDHHVIHRDLKLENIMFESEHPQSPVKVIDFGLSVKFSQTHILKERVGTLYSMSPETMRGECTSKADLWSIGVCVYILLSNGRQPFEAKTPKQLIAKVLQADYSFDDPVWDTISDLAKDFIRSLLTKRPEDRLTAADARKHPWIVTQTVVVDETLKQRVGESMVRYANKSDFLRLAMNVIAKKSTSTEIFELRSVFDAFDTQQKGTLNLAEFKAALAQFKYSEEDLESIFQKIDVNKNNEINYTEFLAAALETQGVIEEYRLAEAFDLLDTDGSGYISKKNLRDILGHLADEKYLDQLIAQADFYHDGRISYPEFLQAFNRQRHELMMSIYGDSSRRVSKRR